MSGCIFWDVADSSKHPFLKPPALGDWRKGREGWRSGRVETARQHLVTELEISGVEGTPSK